MLLWIYFFIKGNRIYVLFYLDYDVKINFKNTTVIPSFIVSSCFLTKIIG